MSKRDIVIGLLHSLSFDDLKVIKLAIEDRLRTGKPEKTDDRFEWLYTVIVRQVQQQIPYERFEGSIYYRDFKKNAPTVFQFLDSVYPNASQVAHQAVVTLVLDGLIADLRKRGSVVTLGVVITNLARFPEIFDSMFPNYIKSGLAKLVLKAMEKTK